MGRFDSWKCWVFCAVTVCFFIQGTFVYTNIGDDSDSIQLSAQEVAGLQHWRKNNCQACHQLHGFGGFLGPDLTNVTDRRGDDYLKKILKDGQKQMPAFGIEGQEAEDLITYLKAMNRTGVGYPTIEPKTLVTSYAALDFLESKHENAKAGLQLMDNMGCIGCHKPLRNSLGPDLTLSKFRQTRAYMAENITQGRGMMPAYSFLKAEEVELILDSIELLGDNRSDIVSRWAPDGEADHFALMELPWFEY